VGTGTGDSKNMTALEAATSAVTLKLNKKGNQAIWGFDIKGVVGVLPLPLSAIFSRSVSRIQFGAEVGRANIRAGQCSCRTR
jgi:hypothetical protein